MSISLSSYFPRTLKRIAKNITDFFPTDKTLWASIRKDDTKISQVIFTVAEEQRALEFQTYTIAQKYIPNFVDSFIEDWEQTLGLPDKCLSINVSDDQRRLNIIIKMRYLNLDTNSSYLQLATLFGTSIVIVPYIGDPFLWQIEISDTTPVAGFPFTFDFNFSHYSEIYRLLECIYQNQKPAHTIVFIYKFPQLTEQLNVTCSK